MFDHTGNVIGALGLSVPGVRMDDVRFLELGDRVTEAAWAVSEQLGATVDGVEETVRRAGGR